MPRVTLSTDPTSPTDIYAASGITPGASVQIQGQGQGSMRLYGGPETAPDPRDYFRVPDRTVVNADGTTLLGYATVRTPLVIVVQEIV